MLSIYSSETPPGSPQPGPSTAPDDDTPPPRRGRPPKRARPAPPSDDDDSDSDDDTGNAWKNSTDPDTEPYRMRFARTREPGFQLPRDQNWSPFDFILGDPGAVSGGGEKSKNGQKKIRPKKSQERGEEPLGTMF